MGGFSIKLKSASPRPFTDKAGDLNAMETYRARGETARGACVSLVYQWIKRSKEAGHPLRMAELKSALGAVQIVQTVYELKDSHHVRSADSICSRFGLVRDTGQSEGPYVCSDPFMLRIHQFAGLTNARLSDRFYSKLESRATEIVTKIASKNGYVELAFWGTEGVNGSYGHSMGAHAGKEYIYFDPNRQIEGCGSDKTGFEYNFRVFLMTYYEDLLPNRYEINVIS
jgi:hypothetical protein